MRQAYMRHEGTTEERFWAKVDFFAADGCWAWLAGPYAAGSYGLFGIPDGKTITAHIYAYELLVGPVAEGKILDHICHNRDPRCPGGKFCLHRRCVNPDHLEQKTIAENVLASPTSLPSINLAKTHCPLGHPLSGDNLFIQRYPNGRESRSCRECRRVACRAYYQRRKVRA